MLGIVITACIAILTCFLLTYLIKYFGKYIGENYVVLVIAITTFSAIIYFQMWMALYLALFFGGAMLVFVLIPVVIDKFFGGKKR